VKSVPAQIGIVGGF